MKYQMVEYQRLINQIRMLRSDLDEKAIVDEAQKIASCQPIRVIDVLNNCYYLAMKGDPMLWEKEHQWNE